MARAICDKGFDLIIKNMSSGFEPDNAAKFAVCFPASYIEIDNWKVLHLRSFDKETILQLKSRFLKEQLNLKWHSSHLQWFRSAALNTDSTISQFELALLCRFPHSKESLSRFFHRHCPQMSFLLSGWIRASLRDNTGPHDAQRFHEAFLL